MRADVVVTVDKEVKRFRVGVRMASQGFAFLKVTDGGSRRIRKEVSKSGENPTYRFDYETQEAVILVPEKLIPITEFISKKTNNSGFGKSSFSATALLRECLKAWDTRGRGRKSPEGVGFAAPMSRKT